MDLSEFWTNWKEQHPEDDDLAHFQLMAAAYEAGLKKAFEVARGVYSK